MLFIKKALKTIFLLFTILCILSVCMRSKFFQELFFYLYFNFSPFYISKIIKFFIIFEDNKPIFSILLLILFFIYFLIIIIFFRKELLEWNDLITLRYICLLLVISHEFDIDYYTTNFYISIILGITLGVTAGILIMFFIFIFFY